MIMKETKFDVFIAYSRKDASGFVSLLIDRIDGLGVKVWNGGEGIEDRGEFIGMIKKGLSNCRLGIVVLSSSLLKDEALCKEIAKLVSKRTRKRVQRVLPVFLDNATPFDIVGGFSNFQFMMHPRDSADRVILQFATLLIADLHARCP